MQIADRSRIQAGQTSFPDDRPRLPASVAMALISLLVCALYGPTLLGLFHDWIDEPDLSYGLLVPPLSLHVAYMGRANTQSRPAVHDIRGLFLIILSCLLFLAGKLGAEFFLCRISFVILIAGLIWTFWGRMRLKSLSFALVLLATMVPLPSVVYNTLAAPLQLLASASATRLAQMMGVTVHRDGNVIQLAEISLGVEEACSGLSALSTLLIGALLFGFFFCRRPLTRLVLFLLTFPIAVFVNILRVTGTAVLADYDRRLGLGFYHTFSGWLVFLTGLLFLYCTTLIVKRWLDRPWAGQA